MKSLRRVCSACQSLQDEWMHFDSHRGLRRVCLLSNNPACQASIPIPYRIHLDNYPPIELNPHRVRQRQSLFSWLTVLLYVGADDGDMIGCSCQIREVAVQTTYCSFFTSTFVASHLLGISGPWDGG